MTTKLKQVPKIGPDGSVIGQIDYEVLDIPFPAYKLIRDQDFLITKEEGDQYLAWIKTIEHERGPYFLDLLIRCGAPFEKLPEDTDILWEMGKWLYPWFDAAYKSWRGEFKYLRYKGSPVPIFMPNGDLEADQALFSLILDMTFLVLWCARRHLELHFVSENRPLGVRVIKGTPQPYYYYPVIEFPEGNLWIIEQFKRFVSWALYNPFEATADIIPDVKTHTYTVYEPTSSWPERVKQDIITEYNYEIAYLKPFPGVIYESLLQGANLEPKDLPRWAKLLEGITNPYLPSSPIVREKMRKELDALMKKMKEESNLQLSDELIKLCLDYKTAGWFKNKASLSPKELLLELNEKYIELFSEDIYIDDNDPEPLDNRIIILDETKTWFDDVEADVTEGADAYVEWMEDLSAITDGQFTPTNITEDWGSKDNKVIVSFRYNNTNYQVKIIDCLDWLDPMFVVGVNEILAKTKSDYRFWFVDGVGQSMAITWASHKEKETLTQLRPIRLGLTPPAPWLEVRNLS